MTFKQIFEHIGKGIRIFSVQSRQQKKCVVRDDVLVLRKSLEKVSAAHGRYRHIAAAEAQQDLSLLMRPISACNGLSLTDPLDRYGSKV